VSHLSVPKIYLDNCCYNRPFDDSSQQKVKNEATAKVFIQSLIKYNSLELHSSFMLLYEISKNPRADKKEHILSFVKKYASTYIGVEQIKEIIALSKEIMQTGIKKKDAIHLTCAILNGCDYFITTDKRLLKYKAKQLKLVNPIEFVQIWRDLT
jgi:predicted nucleic acid-binding protein